MVSKQIEKLKEQEDIKEFVIKFLEQQNVQDYAYTEVIATFMFKL